MARSSARFMGARSPHLGYRPALPLRQHGSPSSLERQYNCLDDLICSSNCCPAFCRSRQTGPRAISTWKVGILCQCRKPRVLLNHHGLLLLSHQSKYCACRYELGNCSVWYHVTRRDKLLVHSRREVLSADRGHIASYCIRSGCRRTLVCTKGL
jgi:hypothetical protein